MGAKVAPTKSLNFASYKAAKQWLAETRWIEINAKIRTVDDLRYLGGHLSTKGNLKNPTLSCRLDKAIDQLRKLRYLPATHED